MTELAIHGGTPVRTAQFPPWPDYDDSERSNLLEVLDSRQWWSSQGTKVHEFERRWGAVHGTGPAVAVTNGSHALDLALLATGIGQGDEVIVEKLIEAGSLYLKQWANRETSPWKFQKARQVWLLRWMYRGDILAKADFKVLLEYMVDLKGGARDRALEKARALAKEGEAEEDSDKVVEKANKITFKRARKVVKTLS